MSRVRNCRQYEYGVLMYVDVESWTHRRLGNFSFFLFVICSVELQQVFIKPHSTGSAAFFFILYDKINSLFSINGLLVWP